MTTPAFKSLNLPKVSERELQNYARERDIPVMSTPTAEPKKEAAAIAPVEPQPVKPVTRVHADLPSDLVDAMKLRAVPEKATVRYYILKALKNDGWAVDAAELVKDGRNPNRRSPD